jgi:hypothetical protein
LSSRSRGKAAASRRRSNGTAVRSKAGAEPARLSGVAEAVRRRAQSQGFVVSRDIRAELARAGMAESLWKQVVNEVGAALSCRGGRYYYVPAGPSRMRARVRRDYRQHQHMSTAVRFLIRQQRALDAVYVERRRHPRVNFVCPVQVQTADRRLLNFLSREISISGVRLIGTVGLQGQKVHVWIPRPGRDAERCCFLVQVLWSAAVADGLHESGGLFVELVEAAPSPLKLAPQ